MQAEREAYMEPVSGRGAERGVDRRHGGVDGRRSHAAAPRPRGRRHVTDVVLVAVLVAGWLFSGCGSTLRSGIGGSPPPTVPSSPGTMSATTPPNSSGTSHSSGTSEPTDTPTLGPTGTPPEPARCGAPGTVKEPGTGPASPLVSVVISVPGRAVKGATIDVNTELVVVADGPRIVLRPATSALQVLRAGVVVATVEGAGGVDVPLPVQAGRRIKAQTVPRRLPLLDCDGRALPPGSYTVRAVVGYGGDRLNEGQSGTGSAFVLVSPPASLAIR